jgi:hypothetical protein
MQQPSFAVPAGVHVPAISLDDAGVRASGQILMLPE